MVRHDPITVADHDHFTLSQFQDTNVVQYDIVKYLAGQDKGLTVVGGNIITAIGYSKGTHFGGYRSGSEYLWLEKCRSSELLQDAIRLSRDSGQESGGKLP